MANKPYHGNTHRRLGTPAVIAANANPSYRCPVCGLTKAEATRRWGAASAKWIRGHKVRAEQATSTAAYRAEHARCSAQEGASVRNAMSANSFGWSPR